MLRSRNSGGRMSMFEEKMKVSRHLLDNDRFQQCIKEVHEFLLGLGFPGTINVRSLHTTAPEDFHLFNSFAFHFSGSSFQFPNNRVEGENVELLKDLGYPVALSKRSVCFIKHCPELLGRLWINWLNDWVINCYLIQRLCHVKEKESFFPCDVEEGAELNEPLWEYCRDTYRKFLEGADTIEKEDEALLNQLLKRSKVDKQRLIPQQKKRRMLMEYVETMERECQDRLKREGSPAQHFLEKQKTPEDVERDNRESEELQQIIQSQTQSRNSGGRMSMFEEKMKVSRHLLEKDSFQQCIKVLHEFLLGLGFPGTINVKSLHTTAPEDFLLFYSFDFHFSGSSFQFPTNGLEGETVELLKDLRYPVALSKRYMCSVEHCPECLGGIWLNWLKDWILNWHVVKMMCEVKGASSFSPCDVSVDAWFNEPLMEYCRDTYRKFLLGARTIEKKDKALLNQLLKRSKSDRERFISQQKERRVLMEELERMEREMSEQNRLKREGSPQSREADLEKQKTPEDIERDNRESEELQQIIQSQTQYVDEIKQLMRNDSDSDTELGGNGAAGVERGGAKTRTSRRGKKVRRRRRK